MKGEVVFIFLRYIFKSFIFIDLESWLFSVIAKVLMQGKLFQRCTHLLYCSVLSLDGNVNTRRVSKPDMGSIFAHQWHILVIGNYYVNYQNYQNLMRLTTSDTKRTLMHLFLFTNSARENWFQYVRRVYATAINFPCIITLVIAIFLKSYWEGKSFEFLTRIPKVSHKIILVILP